MKVVRRAAQFTAVSALAVWVVLLSGCGGFSTEEAEARCDQEEEARSAGGCFVGTTYDLCVSAYEECGDDVVATDSCPLEFVCPAD